ncbi:MAG: hypothetical protein JNM20_06445 [Rhizobiales bacterium]|nr:hypothetical protein [Hyphomicrobiales bacterium]
MTGRVVRAPFGAGSKSEHDAVWLETGEGRLVLRHKGGPAFDDKALAKYVGKQVSCDGFIVGHTLLAEKIRILPS